MIPEEYQNAKPFPHVVLDDWDLAPKESHGTFPDAESSVWYRYDNVFEKKLATNKFEALPKCWSTLAGILNGPTFVGYLEHVTGIPNLIPDPKFRGGGIHMILPGGKLDIHADFNVHPDLQLERRVNVLIYLNKKWRKAWGGELELWDKDMSRCVKRIAPKFNRMVCFNTSGDAFHGHPDPLKCPEGVTRKSFAAYYYTNPGKCPLKPHSTRYQKRPQDVTSDETENLRMLRAMGRLTP